MGSLLNKKKNRKKINDKPKIQEEEKKEIKIDIKAIKLALLGDSAVGKTSIIQSFLNLEFAAEYMTNMWDEKFERKLCLKNVKEVKLILFDTAGQERFRSIALNTIKSVHGVIIAIDVTYRNSFNNLEGWLQEIKEKCSEGISIFLFANKVDIENGRKVSREEIEAFAKAKDLEYFEISARNKIGIDEGFSYIANKAYNKIMEIK